MASHTFDVVAVAFGGLLIGGALISRLAERTALSPVAVFVVVGFVLGRGGLGVINLQRDSGLRDGPGDGRADRDSAARWARGRW